jgi:hypothetical protein
MLVMVEYKCVIHKYSLSLLSPIRQGNKMSKPAVFKDYGQESFTLAQIKAYRKQDEQARKAKEKAESKANRIRTK